MLTVLKAEHQDACVGEFEADPTECVLGVMGAERSVGERDGHRVGLEVLGIAQFLVLIDLSITSMHHVSGDLPHLHSDAPGLATAPVSPPPPFHLALWIR